MQRPFLREVPIEQVFPLKQGYTYITISIGQWDMILRSYYETGAVLIELDSDEQVVRAFQKPFPECE